MSVKQLFQLDGQVALITGEERIEPPNARYLLCTAEATVPGQRTSSKPCGRTDQ